MEKICNKYGSIIIEKTEYGDLTFDTRDENGNIIWDRKESRKKFKQICKEDRRLAKEELLDLLCNRCEDIDLNTIKELFNRLEVRLYHNGAILDFYEVFKELAYRFKSDTESDVD